MWYIQSGSNIPKVDLDLPEWTRIVALKFTLYLSLDITNWTFRTYCAWTVPWALSIGTISRTIWPNQDEVIFVFYGLPWWFSYKSKSCKNWTYFPYWTLNYSYGLTYLIGRWSVISLSMNKIYLSTLKIVHCCVGKIKWSISIWKNISWNHSSLQYFRSIFWNLAKEWKYKLPVHCTAISTFWQKFRESNFFTDESCCKLNSGIAGISSQTFWQKFRESNVLLKKSQCFKDLVWRNIVPHSRKC